MRAGRVHEREVLSPREGQPEPVQLAPMTRKSVAFSNLFHKRVPITVSYWLNRN